MHIQAGLVLTVLLAIVANVPPKNVQIVLTPFFNFPVQDEDYVDGFFFSYYVGSSKVD